MVSGPRAEQRVFGRPWRPCPSRLPARWFSVTRALDLVDQAQLQMVLQVAADARQLVARRRCPSRCSSVARPDAGELQELRRADGAGGQHDLAARGRGVRPVAAGGTRRRRSAGRRTAACSACAPVSTVRFGRPRAGRRKALARGPADAAPLVDLEIAAALVVAAVEVVGLAGCRTARRRRGTRPGSPSAAAAPRRAIRRRRRGTRRRPPVVLRPLE